MITEECPHGDAAELCPPCQDHVAKERSKLVSGEKGARYFGDAVRTRAHRTPRAIIAMHDGDCPECGSQIRAEVDAIAKTESGWCCADCAGAAL